MLVSDIEKIEIEETIYQKNRYIYFCSIGITCSGAIILLFGVGYLPQSVPNSNQLSYLQESADKQQQDLRNYQMASVPFKAIICGLAFIGLGILGFLVTCTINYKQSKKQYEILVDQRQKKLDAEVENQKKKAVEELKRFETQQQQPKNHYEEYKLTPDPKHAFYEDYPHAYKVAFHKKNKIHPLHDDLV